MKERKKMSKNKIIEGFGGDLKKVTKGKTALIREIGDDGRLVAGFLDRSSGVFEEVCEVSCGEDIDRFLEDYGLTTVLICRKKR